MTAIAKITPRTIAVKNNRYNFVSSIMFSVMGNAAIINSAVLPLITAVATLERVKVGSFIVEVIVKIRVSLGQAGKKMDVGGLFCKNEIRQYIVVAVRVVCHTVLVNMQG